MVEYYMPSILGRLDMPVAESSTSDPRAYVRLAVLLRKLIAEGELLPGDPAPSITSLVQDHGHARQTCAKALRLLVDEGPGYYVAADARGRLLGGGLRA
jgi:DNA-binding transcriptional regulator YhcF (GntR family)